MFDTHGGKKLTREDSLESRDAVLQRVERSKDDTDEGSLDGPATNHGRKVAREEEADL